MFRFSIRDVLWLTVVVGLGLGWWRESVISSQGQRWQSKAQTIARALRERGWTVRFGDDSLDVRDETGTSIFNPH
jgi:hypothetical protein